MGTDDPYHLALEIESRLRQGNPALGERLQASSFLAPRSPPERMAAPRWSRVPPA